MKGIVISDEKDGYLSFDLISILEIIGHKALLSTWKVSNVECIGKYAERMNYVSDDEIEISGVEILNLASNINQVIAGEFRAYLNGDNLPWLIIRAIDSSEYGIECNEMIVLGKLKDSFGKVVDLPE